MTQKRPPGIYPETGRHVPAETLPQAVARRRSQPAAGRPGVHHGRLGHAARAQGPLSRAWAPGCVSRRPLLAGALPRRLGHAAMPATSGRGPGPPQPGNARSPAACSGTARRLVWPGPLVPRISCPLTPAAPRPLLLEPRRHPAKRRFQSQEARRCVVHG